MADFDLNTGPDLPPKTDYGIGCIGAGFIMRDIHLPAYNEAGFRPVAIASRTPEHARAAAEANGVPKVYEADVEGVPDQPALRALRDGVELEDGRTSPADVRVLRRSGDSSLLELTLHEGRKRQVRRMCEAVGHPVQRLHRSRYAGLDLEGLAPGESRSLTSTEVAALRRAAGL